MTEKITRPEIETLMNGDLSRSGLDLATIAQLGLRSMLPEETSKRTSGTHEVPAYLIPYFDMAGKKVDFYRIKFLEEVMVDAENGDKKTKVPSFRKKRKKLQKYTQPAHTSPRFYLPPNANWKAIAKNTGRDIMFTEGEKKAARACQEDIACIGLGGVWNWLQNKQPIDDFELFDWVGRKVVICFDSDVNSNPLVLKALNRLGDELVNRGARVYIKLIPYSPADGSKMGIDDYMETYDVVRFNALAEKEMSASAHLWKMNEHVAFVHGESSTVLLRTGRLFQNVHNLIHHVYANEEFVVWDGDKKQVKNAMKEWVKWRERREHSRVCYRPGEAEVVLPANELNTWKGWGCEPKKGSVTPWHDLLDHVFSDLSDEHRKWFEQWCAYPLQYPGTKLFQACLVWSPFQGVGKSLTGYILGKIYGSNFVTATREDLIGKFNAWRTGKQFVLGEEITANEGRAMADQLKNIITSTEFVVHKKFQPEYMIEDCANLFLTSNHMDAVYLDDYDRRFFIHQVTQSAKPETFYRAIDKWKEGNGPSALFHHLLEEVDCSEFNPKGHAPKTVSRRAMINIQRSEMDQFAEALFGDPGAILRMDGVTLNRDIFTLEELFHLLPARIRDKQNATTTALAKSLKRVGFHAWAGGQPVYTKLGTIGLWPIRNVDKWMKADRQQVREHYETAFGSGGGDVLYLATAKRRRKDRKFAGKEEAAS